MQVWLDALIVIVATIQTDYLNLLPKVSTA